MMTSVTIQRVFLAGLLCVAGSLSAVSAQQRVVPGTAPLALPTTSAAPATPVPLDTPAVTDAPPADVTARARAALDGIMAGKPDRGQFNGDQNQVLNDDVVRQKQAQLQLLGSVASFAYVRTMTVQGSPIYVYRIGGTSGQPAQFEQISFDPNGKIARLSFVTQLV